MARTTARTARPEIQANGWTWDPRDMMWTAKTGPHTWTRILNSDLNSPPRRRPQPR